MKLNLANTAIISLIVVCAAGCSDKSKNPGDSTQSSAPALPIAQTKVASLEATVSCNIEKLNNEPLEGGKLITKQNKDSVITGWVIDKVGVSNGDPISIHIEDLANYDEWEITNIQRGPREDIKAAFKNDVYNNSGFTVTIPANSLSPGQYSLSVIYRGKNADISCGRGTVFTLKD